MLAPLTHTWNGTSQVCRIQFHHTWLLFVPREHVCSGPTPIIPLGHHGADNSFWLTFLSRRSSASANSLTQRYEYSLGLPWEPSTTPHPYPGHSHIPSGKRTGGISIWKQNFKKEEPAVKKWCDIPVSFLKYRFKMNGDCCVFKFLRFSFV